MSPEEIEWDNGGSAGAAEPFEVRPHTGMVRACESLVTTTTSNHQRSPIEAAHTSTADQN